MENIFDAVFFLGVFGDQSGAVIHQHLHQNHVAILSRQRQRRDAVLVQQIDLIIRAKMGDQPLFNSFYESTMSYQYFEPQQM